MNLSLIHIAYFYFTIYCGCPVASTTDSTGENKGRSLFDWVTLGSVGGGATFASDLGYAPSVG